MEFTQNRSIKKTLIIVFVTVLIALMIRFFVFEPYKIPTNTMSPTLQPGDLILVQKWPFGVHSPFDHTPLISGRMPKYGEVVLYSPADQPEINFLKRVVGLPGDNIQIQKGRLILNQKLTPFKKSNLNDCGTETLKDHTYQICLNSNLIDTQKTHSVPEGSVFVVGDLRSKSVSLKDWDIIPVPFIRAKASFIWLSIAPSSQAQSWIPEVRFNRVFSFIK